MRALAAFVVLTLGLAHAASAQQYQPDFDPTQFKGPAASPPSEIMVLGTPHLSQMKQFDIAHLAALNARLAAWGPQLIAIEAMSGLHCDKLRHYPQRYADTVKTYCRDTAAGQRATGLDVGAATERADQILAQWRKPGAQPTPAQRRELAAVFLAGGEQASALVQWLRLPEGERHEGEGLDAALVALLRGLETKRDESLQIATRLAARLGIDKLVPMDDQSSETVDEDPKASGAAIMKAWDNPATRQRQVQDKALQAAATDDAGVLAMYRAYNAPGAARLVFESDFGAAMNEPSPQRYGRGYLAYWEARNLRMAANIRAGLETRPGARMLVIVGASHKGYLEAYLNLMHDLRIADTGPVLK
jgi:hypothetical protein